VSRRLWALAALGTLLALTTARGQPERTVYLGELRKRAPETARILRTLQEQEVTAAQLQKGLDALYRARVWDSLLRARLDPRSAPREARYLGAPAWVEAQVQRRLAQLGDALRQHQRDAAARALTSQAPPGPDELLARWPLAPQAQAAALVLWGRAVARGDVVAARELRVWSQRWHPEAPAWPTAPRPSAATPSAIPPDARLTLVETVTFAPGAARGGASARCLPTLVANQVAISDGARLHLYTRQGATRGSFPLSVKAASGGPDLTTPFEARVAAWGDLAFAPLLLDGPLAPARRTRLSDSSFAGRYFSLVGYDVRRGRLSWWDGDSGRGLATGSLQGGAPPGWEASPLLSRLRGAHPLACAVGPQRVYVAYTVQGQDPELYVMAYRRQAQPGGQLGLRPAWPAPAHVLTTERRRGDATDPLLAPEISAALTLHPAAGLVLATDVGVVAALSPRRGELRWLRRVIPGRSRFKLSAEPALEAGPEAVAYLYRGRLVSLDAATGLLRWGRAIGNAVSSPRHMQPWGDDLLLTGGPELWWARKRDGAPAGGKLLARQSRAAGRCARVGGRVLIPNWTHGPQTAILVVERKSGQQRQRVELPGFGGPASVQAWGETVVLANTHRAAFLRWRKDTPAERRKRELERE
jgi:putative pyrroloquinoline-quinone binding quinoprotein